MAEGNMTGKRQMTSVAHSARSSSRGRGLAGDGPRTGLFASSPGMPFTARAAGLALLWLAGTWMSGVGSALTGANAAHARDSESAVVFMYHRFGEDRYPSTNIRLEQFEAHLRELTSGPYTVLGLETIIDALRNGRALPPRSVAITIDDAYRSAYTEAWPRLREAGLPFTLFVATDAVDQNRADSMSWDQIRELAEAGVTIGNHTASHASLPTLKPEEIRDEYRRSNARFQSELGFVPRLQAYPYGEASAAAMAEARAAGFIASFGQHSGVVHWADNGAGRDYLPRFALNEAFGDMDRFRLAANALSLFETDVTPADPTLGANPPLLGFTVGPGLGGLDRLACFSSAHGRVETLALDERRIEVRLPDAFRPGRGRVNCTLPAQDSRWRWFGIQFFIPTGGG